MSSFMDTKSDSLLPRPVRTRSFFNQTWVLLRKNYLVFARNIKSTLFMLLTPILICFVLLGLSSVIGFYFERVNTKDTFVQAEKSIHVCRNKPDCLTIGYGIAVRN